MIGLRFEVFFFGVFEADFRDFDALRVAFMPSS